jgi:hypothetical protein
MECRYETVPLSQAQFEDGPWSYESKTQGEEEPWNLQGDKDNQCAQEHRTACKAQDGVLLRANEVPTVPEPSISEVTTVKNQRVVS